MLPGRGAEKKFFAETGEARGDGQKSKHKTKKERIGILEAKKLGIPVIGLIDTNCNPEDVDYAIPGNDDAIRAVGLIADCMANAVIEGRQGEAMDTMQEEVAEETAEPESIEEVVAAEETTQE